MKSKNAKNIGIVIVCLILGFIMGAAVNDIPLITFNTSVDVSSVLAMLGLLATIFIMPSIVDDRIRRRENTNIIILKDIDEACDTVRKLMDIYDGILPNRNINEKNYSMIISTFKRLSSSLYGLSSALESDNILTDFKSKVIADGYAPAYASCTENLKNGKSMNKNDLDSGKIALNDFYQKIKTYRYKLYR